MHFQFFLCMSLLLSLTACNPSQSATEIRPSNDVSNTIDAHHYDAFWIWGDISSAPYLTQAKEIYVLQGEIKRDRSTQKSIFIPQGVAVLKVPHQKVWLVFRNHHLNWQDDELTQILKRVQQWKSKGNQIVGIQIDFDAKTKNLKEYALFLQQIRQQLPKKYQLSITGLLDWANIQDTETLRLLKDNIDELAIQTYQGSTTIPNYQSYLKKVSKLNLPYKIGLIQHGEWNRQLDFKSDPNFKGYVVFLLKD